MTLEQLRVFVAVAEREHVTRAAEALNLAQSAVSAAIAALEARHGARLFDRVGRGIQLSEAGRLFLVEARAVLGRVDAAELVLSELGGLKRGTLAVQASQTISSYWLPRHLVAFRQAHPGIDIRLRVGNTAQVAAAVHEGDAELGFVEGAVDDPALTSRPVARDQMVIVVGPDHPWATPRGYRTRRSVRDGMGAARARLRHQIGVRGGAGRLRHRAATACAWRWSFPPTRRCAPPWKPAWGPPRSPPRWPRQAWKRACCTGST